jgi:hypothetical protein
VRVVIAPEAGAELADIWEWNANDRGTRHADSYLKFLAKSIGGLGRSYSRGKAVENRPDLRYIQIKRKS